MSHEILPHQIWKSTFDSDRTWFLYLISIAELTKYLFIPNSTWGVTKERPPFKHLRLRVWTELLKAAILVLRWDTLNRRALNYDSSELGGIIWAIKRAHYTTTGSDLNGTNYEYFHMPHASEYLLLEVDRVKLGNKANTNSTAYRIPNGFSFMDQLGDVTEWIQLNKHLIWFVLAMS